MTTRSDNDIKSALATIVDRTPELGPAPGEHRTAIDPPDRKWQPVAAIAAAAAMIVAAGVLVAGRDTQPNEPATSSTAETPTLAPATTLPTPINTAFLPVFEPPAEQAQSPEAAVNAYLEARFADRLTPFGLTFDWQPAETGQTTRQGDTAAVQVTVNGRDGSNAPSLFVGTQLGSNGWYVFVATSGAVTDGLEVLELGSEQLLGRIGLFSTDVGQIEIADPATGLAFADGGGDRSESIPSGASTTSVPLDADGGRVIDFTLPTNGLDPVMLRWYLSTDGADRIDYFGEVVLATDQPDTGAAASVVNRLIYAPQASPPTSSVPPSPGTNAIVFAPLEPDAPTPFSTQLTAPEEHPDIKIVSVSDAEYCIEGTIGSSILDGCGDLAVVSTGLDHGVLSNPDSGVVVFGIVPDEVDLVEVGGRPVPIIGNVWLATLDTTEPRELRVTDQDTGIVARLPPPDHTDTPTAPTTTID